MNLRISGRLVYNNSVLVLGSKFLFSNTTQNKGSIKIAILEGLLFSCDWNMNPNILYCKRAVLGVQDCKVQFGGGNV